MRHTQPLRWDGSMIPLTAPKAVLYAAVAAGLAMLAHDGFDAFKAHSVWAFVIPAAVLGPLYFHIVSRSKIAMLSLNIAILIVAGIASSIAAGSLLILSLVAGTHLLNVRYAHSRFKAYGLNVTGLLSRIEFRWVGNINTRTGLPIENSHLDIFDRPFSTSVIDWDKYKYPTR